MMKTLEEIREIEEMKQARLRAFICGSFLTQTVKAFYYQVVQRVNERTLQPA